MLEWVSGDRSAIAQWDYGIIPVSGSSPAPAHGRTKSKDPGHGDKKTKTVTDTYVSQMSAGHKTTIESVATVEFTTPTATSTANPAAAASPAPSHVPGGIAYHRFYRQTQLLFSETRDQADWGYWYWATNNVANLTYQSGSDADVRTSFATVGYLQDTEDTNYRAIMANYPVFGYAVDLGSVGASSVNTLFSMGLAQQEAVQFDSATGIVPLPSLWTSYFATDLDAVRSITQPKTPADTC